MGTFAARQHGACPVSPRNAVETEVDGFHRSDHAQILACVTDDVAWDLPGFRYLRARAAFDGKIENETISGGSLTEKRNPFNSLSKKPNHLNAADTVEQLQNSESETERKTYAVALEKKYLTGVLPFIITLFTAPFALSLSRRGKVATVGYAVAVWLLFMGITSYFEQLGLNGYFSPSTAVWSPLIIFTVFGVFLMSKVKT